MPTSTKLDAAAAQADAGEIGPALASAEVTKTTQTPLGAALLGDSTDRSANPPPGPATQTDLQVHLPAPGELRAADPASAASHDAGARAPSSSGRSLSEEGFGEEVTAADYRPRATSTDDVPTDTRVLPGKVDVKDPYVGTVVADRYRILGKIGEGGMGTVYLAEHRVIERRVALKILSQDFARKADLVQRFIQEARAAARIGHKNIIEVTDFGETASGSVFFAMEYLEGQDLSQVIRSQAPLPPGRVRRIASQICQALGAAHSKKIIHRDLKPENIFLLDREGQQDFVKVLDFGIAKITSIDEGNSGAGRLTRTGMIFGTPEYMSPEQARGDAPDHRVDIYAVGCIIYEMLTGTVPFSADTFMGVLTKHMFEVLEPPSRRARVPIPQDIEMICMRALEKDRERRFQTMQDVVAALDNESGVVYSSPVPLQDPSRVMGYTPGLGVPVSYSQANNPNGPQGVPAAMHSPQVSGAVPAGMNPGMVGMPQGPVYVQIPGQVPMGQARMTDATAESALPLLSHAGARRAWFIIIGMAAGLFVGGYLLLFGRPDPDGGPAGAGGPGVSSGAGPRSLPPAGQGLPLASGDAATLVLTGTRDALVLEEDGNYLGRLPMQQPYRLKGRGPVVRKFIIRKESKEQTVELILEAGKTTERNVELFPAKHREEGKPEGKPESPGKPESKGKTGPVTAGGLKDPF